MKIVIDIPDNEYTRWIEDGEINALVVRDALEDGTPLPKGLEPLIMKLIEDVNEADGGEE